MINPHLVNELGDENPANDAKTANSRDMRLVLDQAWIKLGSSLDQAWLKLSSSVAQAWQSSSLAQAWLNLGTSLAQAWFKLC